jgi:hypothetical protein
MKLARVLLPLLALVVLGASSAPASAKDKPNLKVSTLTVQPGTLHPGERILNTATVANNGRATAGKSETTFVLSSDALKSKNDTLLQFKQKVGKLKKKKRATATTEGAIPASIAPGTYFVGACADGSSKVKESKETDNCTFAKAPITVTAFPTSVNDGPPAAQAPVNTVLPSIDGSPGVGSSLTAVEGTWTPSGVIFLRTWLLCTDDSTLASCTVISGQDGTTYTPVAGDANKFIRVRITGTNAKGSVDATSAATAIVAPDTDADGVPDTLDCAPMVASLPGTHPEAGSCAGTIYDINNGNSSDGASVVLKNVLVTAVSSGGDAFVQVKLGDPGFSGTYGGQFSGVEVSGVPGTVNVGNRVDIVGLREDTATDRTVAADSVDVVSAGPEVTGFTTITPATLALSLDVYDAVPIKLADQTITSISGGVWTLASGATVGKSLIGSLPGSAQVGDSVDVSGIASRTGAGTVLPRISGDITIALRMTGFVADGSVFEGESNKPIATVTLNHAAPTDTFVTVGSSSGEMSIVNGGVTIAAGMTTGRVYANGNFAGPVLLTATLSGFNIVIDHGVEAIP